MSLLHRMFVPLVAAIAMGGVVVAAEPANAAVVRPACVVNEFTNGCNRPVPGTPWGTAGDNVRKTPSTSGQLLTVLSYGGWTNVECYAVGTTYEGDSYWDFVDSVNDHTGYIADALLNTGGDINRQALPCISGLQGS